MHRLFPANHPCGRKSDIYPQFFHVHKQSKKLKKFQPKKKRRKGKRKELNMDIYAFFSFLFFSFSSSRFFLFVVFSFVEEKLFKESQWWIKLIRLLWEVRRI